MASITTRSGKGSPLTNAELDANFTNLNSELGGKLVAANNLSDITSQSSARTNIGLGSVENKSSATIRSEISSANVTGALGYTPPEPTGTGASGTWGISITGNAGTVTNGIYSNSSYADPAWITSLSGGKVSGNISGNAANVTGTVAVANGGTGATDAATALTNLGATTVGANLFTLTNPGAIRFLRLNANNTVSALSADDFKTAIGSSGGGLTYVVKTSAYTAADKEGVLTDTSGGAFTVTLPATPAVGAQVVVADATGTWGTNNLTVARNGSTIGGLAENLVCDISSASVQLVYDGTTWRVYAQIGGASGSVVTLTATQTLTNKTIDFNSNTILNAPAGAPFTSNTALAQVQASVLSF